MSKHIAGLRCFTCNGTGVCEVKSMHGRLMEKRHVRPVTAPATGVSRRAAQWLRVVATRGECDEGERPNHESGVLSWSVPR